MAQKKTTKKNNTAVKRQTGKRSVGDGVRREIWIFLVLAVAAVLFLGSINSAGKIGEKIYGVLHGLFGSMGYIFPFLLFGLTVYLMFFVRKYGPMAFVIAGTVIAAFWLMCGIFELINGKGLKAVYTLSEYYRLGTDGFNGGLFGGIIFKTLVPGLGMLGAYAIVVILELVCLIFITGKSVLGPLKSGGKRIVSSTKSGMEHFKRDREEKNDLRDQRIKRRQEARLREEEEKQERLKKRAEGVELSGTDLMHPGFTPASPVKKPKKTGFVEDIALEDTLTVEEALEAMPGPVIGDEPGWREASKKTDASLEKLLERVEKKEKERVKEESAPDTDIRKDSPKPIRAAKDSRTLAELDALEVKKQSGLFAASDDISSDTTTWIPSDANSIYTADRVSPSKKDEQPAGEFDDEIDNPMEGDWYGHDDSGELPDAIVETLEPAEAIDRLTKPIAAHTQEGKKGSAGIWSTGASNRESTAGKTFSQGIGGEQKRPEQKIERTEGKVVQGGISTPGYAKPIIKKNYRAPGLSLLTASSGKSLSNREELKNTAQKLVETLHNFGVNVNVTDVSCGPAVTRYELQPEQGVKVSRIVSLSDDIKLNLAAADIRIEAPIPGKSAVGIEVPNKENNTVYLRDILKSDAFTKSSSKITVGIGSDIAGEPVVADISKMPHLLIAGATNSGKSVCINTIIVSILYKASPEDVRFIMIDPKMVELSAYNGIPHLLIPVVTDPKKAAAALNWAVTEMIERYQHFSDFGVRDIKSYNHKVEEILEENGVSEGTEENDLPQKMPQIVIVVDELADLMMVSPGEVEEAICRLAQLARAAGIHLVIATQRPSVNVITGLIKANMPSRIAFAVTSGIDSRTILDMVGAEKLLGRGDMLFYPAGYSKPVRVQGAFVSDDDVAKVVDFVNGQRLTTEQADGLERSVAAAGNGGGYTGGGGERDDLFVQCGRYIIDKEKASIGNLQRAFRIGFNRAARIMDQLCEAGVVGEEEGTKPRQILMTVEEFEELIQTLQ